MKQKDNFHLYWAFIFILIAIIGFAPTYWIPLFKGNLKVSAFVQWHAIFSVVWIVIFLLQVTLVQYSKIKIHQSLGYFSVLVAAGVLISGILVSIDLLYRANLAGNPGAKPSLLINFSDMLMFGIVFFVGVLKRYNLDDHKRLITLSLLILMNAGLFRIGRLIIGPGFGSIVMAIVLTSGLIILYVFLDKKMTGKVNKTLKRFSIAVIIVHIIRIPIAVSPLWTSVSDSILEVW